jgi:hypothetical protein
MPMMSKTVVALILLAVLVGCGLDGPIPAKKGEVSSNTSGAVPPSQTSLSEWKSDIAVVAELASYEDLGGYQIRPPKGYERISPQQGPEGAKIFGWGGPPHADGTRPSLTVMLVTIPPEGRTVSAEVLMDKTVASLKRRYADCQMGPVESGLVNGMAFSRAGFQGTPQEVPAKLHGRVFSGKQGDTWIQMQSRDVGPDHEKSLKVRDAALLSFRAKSGAKPND